MNVCVYIGCARARSVVALRSSISNSNIIKKVERKNEINAGIELVVVLPLLLLLRIFLFFAFRHSRWNFLCGFFHIESPFAECSYGNSLSEWISLCSSSSRWSRRNEMKKNQTEKYYLLKFFLPIFILFAFDNDSMFSMLGVGNGNVRQVWRIMYIGLCVPRALACTTNYGQFTKRKAFSGALHLHRYHV